MMIKIMERSFKKRFENYEMVYIILDFYEYTDNNGELMVNVNTMCWIFPNFDVE